jgi:hypothetical protein
VAVGEAGREAVETTGLVEAAGGGAVAHLGGPGGDPPGVVREVTALRSGVAQREVVVVTGAAGPGGPVWPRRRCAARPCRSWRRGRSPRSAQSPWALARSCWPELQRSTWAWPRASRPGCGTASDGSCRSSAANHLPRSTARAGGRSCSPRPSESWRPPPPTGRCWSSTTCSGPTPAASPCSGPPWPACPPWPRCWPFGPATSTRPPSSRSPVTARSPRFSSAPCPPRPSTGWPTTRHSPGRYGRQPTARRFAVVEACASSPSAARQAAPTPRRWRSRSAGRANDERSLVAFIGSGAPA